MWGEVGEMSLMFTRLSLLSQLSFYRSEIQCRVTPIAKNDNPNYTFSDHENEPVILLKTKFQHDSTIYYLSPTDHPSDGWPAIMFWVSRYHIHSYPMSNSQLSVWIVSLIQCTDTQVNVYSFPFKQIRNGKHTFKKGVNRAPGVAQSVKYLISAQVMISWFMSLSPTLGSMMTMWRLLKFSLPSSLCPSSLLKINKNKYTLKKRELS